MEIELTTLIKNEIPGLSEEDSGLIIERFCKIKAPEIIFPEQESHMDFFTIHSAENKVSSIKAGNIVLNMKKLLIDSAEIGLTIAGVVATPYLIPLAALLIWNKVWSNIKIDLGENQAIAIKLMWENRNIKDNTIEESDVFYLFNQYLKSKNRNELVIEDFKRVLNDLEKMKCIEKKDSTRWWLREWVKKRI
nr:hypothetical protein [uncultured Draconibacterium sp.]